MKRRAAWVAALVAATAVAAAAGGARPDPLRYVAAMAVPFAIYLAAMVDILREPAGARPGLVWLVLGGLAMGIAFAAVPPRFEDDFYRYEWDARVASAGINPYRYAPADEALRPLRGPAFGRIGYPEVPTCYPPLAEVWFRAAVGLADALGVPALRGFQVLGLLAAAGVTMLLGRILAGTGLPPQRAAIWSLNPLVAKEIGNSAHYDVLAALLATAALWAIMRRRSVLAGILLGMAVDAKIYPLVLAPILFRRGAARSWLAMVLTVAAGFVPYAAAGPHLFTGLRTYATIWRFNAPIFPLLERLFPTAARPVAAALVLAAVAWRTARPSSRPAQDCVFVLGAMLLLSPTLDPWYLAWILPFLALEPSAPWIALTGLSTVSYLYYLQHAPMASILTLEFVPFLVLAAWKPATARLRWCRAAPRPAASAMPGGPPRR